MQPIINYNPDVLTCLANLSNDEVFTPPSVVNQMLDQLPSELWRDKNATFLDPVSKTGVFLREIAVRLNKGLESQIPDRQERINHIYKNQVFGLAITELTSLLSRRGVYCSKTANGKYSICTDFNDEQGNIRYERMEHTWQNGRCTYCGASESEYNREDALETYAYQFIHTNEPETFFNNMKFDVIIGNPPYQLNDGGGTGSSAIPVYQKFVEQAKKLNPTYLSMIIPSRWFTGGRALDSFRDEMLRDNRISVIHDFLNASDCFPGVEIKGGVCYFLWDRTQTISTCRVYTHDNNKITESNRPLLEPSAETFIRHNDSISILQKVQKKNESLFSELVSANDPFGFDTRVEGGYKRVEVKYKKEPFQGSVAFYYNGWRKNGLGYVNKEDIKKNQSSLKGFKVLIPKAWGVGNANKDWLEPFIVGPDTCCTETYLAIGPFKTKKEAENVVSYTQTKFFHLLVSMIKITQNSMKKVYSFVPVQDFSEPWNDEKLFKKYKLTKDEIAFIDSLIRPMD